MSPLGCLLDTVWNRLVNGQSGLKKASFGDENIPCKVAAFVPRGKKFVSILYCNPVYRSSFS